jgi:hypothetical protein
MRRQEHFHPLMGLHAVTNCLNLIIYIPFGICSRFEMLAIPAFQTFTKLDLPQFPAACSALDSASHSVEFESTLCD